MSNQIKELVLPAALVVLLMVYPAVVLAESQGLTPTPFTAAYSAGEWIVDKLGAKTRLSLHTPERQAKFDSWAKEDWIKDDAYACMWDRNWIKKATRDVCQ